MAKFLARLGGLSARHRWLTIVVWLGLLAAAGGAAHAWSRPMSSAFTIDGLSSITMLERIEHDFGAGGGPGGRVVFAAPRGQVLTDADRATIAGLSSRIAAVPGVAGVPELTLPEGSGVGYLSVTLTGDDVPDGLAAAVQAARSPALRVEMSSEIAPADDAGSGADVGLLIALAVLLVTFGSLIAAGTPLLTALLGLGIGLAVIEASTRFVDLTDVAPSLATLLALAVGIDYALFVVDRHRRQLLTGMPVRQSIELAVGTAGTAVVFAALTVVGALAGLAIMRVGFLTQMGLSAAAAVLVAMLITVTLTPALLSVAGPRILGRRARRRLAAGRTPATGGALARRWTGLLARFPVAAVAVAVLLLGALAVPVLDLRLGLPTDGSLPGTSTARRAYDLLAEGFGAGVNAPILVLGTAQQENGIAALPGVAGVQPTGERDGQVLLTVFPRGGPEASGTSTLVHDLRERPGLEVTGRTAVALDVSELLAERLPRYVAVIAAFAFLLLLVAFRSILVPLKATASFLLGLGAALGCTVLVFQQGHLGDLLGVDPAGPLLAFLPVIVIGVLFGLSMDYEMFLLTGMHEQHTRGTPARDAVHAGYHQGARVVTAAALIMVGVFGAGALGNDATIKPIAFALAVGVGVDAFVVRLFLVPAVMFLLGRAAWWFPRALERITPHLDLEGSALRDDTPPDQPETAERFPAVTSRTGVRRPG